MLPQLRQLRFRSPSYRRWVSCTRTISRGRARARYGPRRLALAQSDPVRAKLVVSRRLRRVEKCPITSAHFNLSVHRAREAEVGDRRRCSMNLTDEQHAICQAACGLDVGSSLKIQAFAGTGKTTTLAAIAESLAQRKFLYLVFNRAAADEAEHKMPSNVTVRTAHALAFRSVGYVYKSRLASSPWAWFPYLKEKMPRALDSVVRMEETRLLPEP